MNTPKDYWERCPVCRARLKTEMECPRCDMDFRAALSVAEQGKRLRRSVVGKLHAGENEQALWTAMRAVRMHSSPEAMKMLAAAALANKHHGLALELWGKIERTTNTQVRSEISRQDTP